METEYSFDLSKYEIIQRIGKGAFGAVYKVKEIKTGVIFAAKISLLEFEEEEEIEAPKALLRNLIREINIISKLYHPAIVKFIGFSPYDFEGNFKPTIVSECVNRGDLSGLIEKAGRGIADPKWDDTQKLITLYGIASAMSFLHEHQILHRDLKPENILMDDDLYPKIADFGLSKIIHLNQESMSLSSTIGFKGTALYTPPEILLDYDYSKADDVYSFAMIAYEILTNEIPFQKCKLAHLIEKIKNGERPIFDSMVPDAYQSLIERCWAQEASERPTFNEIADEVKTNPEFITDMIDEDAFLSYVDYIDECKSSFSAGRNIVSIKDFIKKRKRNLELAKSVSDGKQQTQKEEIAAQTEKQKDKTSFHSPDLLGNISDEENGKNVSFNDKVRAILDDKDSEIKKLPWSKKYLVNCLQADNPLISQSALLLSKQKTGGSNNTINLFSEKSRPIHFQKIEEAPAFWRLMKASNAKMLSDFTDKSKPPKIQKNDFNDLPSPDYCFYQKNKAHRRILTIEDKSLSGPTKEIFACLEIRDIKYDFEMIEPLFFGVFLIQNGSIINEQWTSAFKGIDQFMSNTSVSSKAYIELPLSYNNAFLCVVISRFLLPENGSAVDLYYQNQSVKALQSAKMQTKFFNKFIGVFAPFALTLVDLKTVIDNKYFDMPLLFAISKPLHVILKQIKNGKKLIQKLTQSILHLIQA